MSDDEQQTDASSAQPGDSEPRPERQADLRAAYEKNVAAGRAPYEGVHIGTRGELRWVMQERRWSVEYDVHEGYERVNLSGAVLTSAVLSGVDLHNANLSGADVSSSADLSGADLSGADLSEANLYVSLLSEANLIGADLSEANLIGADLSEANLIGADLSGANLRSANLRGANLSLAQMGAKTRLHGAQMDVHTFLADVVWNGVPLSGLNWEDLPVLGDETLARESQYRPKELPVRRMLAMARAQMANKKDLGDYSKKDMRQRRGEYESAVRAYRLLSAALRGQGLNENADRFAYRAQLMRRQVLRHQGMRTWPAYIGSLLLDLLAGYGYRPGQAIWLYIAVIVWFANFYVWASHGVFSLGMPRSTVDPLAWYEALILSVSSFHGRGFQPFQHLNDPIAALAGIQAVLGLVIEVSFIATFTNRFFAL